mgnify:CR=1 FL=1
MVPGHELTGPVQLAQCLLRACKFAEAEPYAREAVSVARATQGEQDASLAAGLAQMEEQACSRQASQASCAGQAHSRTSIVCCKPAAARCYALLAERTCPQHNEKRRSEL